MNSIQPGTFRIPGVCSKSMRRGNRPFIAAASAVMVLGLVFGVRTLHAVGDYEMYTVRAKFMDGVIVADGMKTPVAEYSIEHDGAWPSSNAQAGIAEPVADLPKVVQSASVGPGGVITVVFSADVAALNGKSVVFSPALGTNGIIRWKCSAPSIDVIYLSASCRNDRTN
jgi:type IV pilus assembly protein PilA